jgi:hypothetical protein
MSGGSKPWFRSLVLDVVRLQVRPPVASPAYRGLADAAMNANYAVTGSDRTLVFWPGCRNSIWNYPSCPSDASSFLLCLPQQ